MSSPQPRRVDPEGFSALQRFTMYITAVNLFIVGSDKARSQFRILIIDRTQLYNLELVEDPYIYPPSAIIPRLRQLIDRGGHPLSSHFSFHGLVGFLPLPKLHLVLITNKHKVGSIAGRWVYGISDWTLMPLQHTKGERGDRGQGQEGGGKTGKYRELINGHIDLTKDFYFSYYYDLTNSLQHNLTATRSDPHTDDKKLNDTPHDTLRPPDDQASTIVKSISTPSFSTRPSSSSTDSVLLAGLTHSPSTSNRPLSPLSKSQSFSSNPWADLTSSFAAAANAPPAAVNGSSANSSPPSSSSPSTPTSASRSSFTSSTPSAPYLPSLPPRHHLYNDQFLWNFYLTHSFLLLLPNSSYWLIPLIHGFFQQSLIRHAHHDLLITLIARRSRHYAGTRYIKRGVNPQGHVANEVESEQVVECSNNRSTWFNTGASYSSVLLLRGSIPLYWWQENVQSLKPNIVIAPNQEQYQATRLHIDDLLRRYGHNLDMLSLIKKKENNPQETRLGFAYTAAVAWLREAYREEEGVKLDYQTYDFINMRAAKANVLRDVRKLVAPAVEQQGVFAHVNVIEKDDRKEGGVTSASELMRRERRSIHRTSQSGVVRINCVDCLDRTNVAQFCVGKAAMRLQLTELGLISAGEKVWPELLQVLQRFFTAHGDRIAQQYAGSGAMHRDALYDKEKEEDEETKDNNDLISGGVGQATRDRLTAERDATSPTPPSTSPPPPSLPLPSQKQKPGAGMAHNAISFAKRYYSNNVTDVEKQQAINVFLGHFIPQADRKQHVWDVDAGQPLMEFDEKLKGRGNDFWYVPYNPNFVVEMKEKKRKGEGGGGEGAGEGVKGEGVLGKKFEQFFDEKYNPTKLTSLEKELNKTYQKPVYVGGGMITEQKVEQKGGERSERGMPVAQVVKEGTPVSRGSEGSVEPSPIIGQPMSSLSSLVPPLPLQDDELPSITVMPQSPHSRSEGYDLRSSLSPSATYSTPPHSPSPHSLSRHNSIDMPSPSPSQSSAPPSPSHSLTPHSSNTEPFTFNLAQGVTSAPHPGHKSGLAQANAVANKVGAAVGAATKSFFTKGLKTAFGVNKGGGGGQGGGTERSALHRVKSTGSVHGPAVPLAIPVAALAVSRSQDFSFLDAGNAVTLQAAMVGQGQGGERGGPLSPPPLHQSPRKGLPPTHHGLPSSSSFAARSLSPQAGLPRDSGSGLTRLDDLVTSLGSNLPSYYTHDSPQHQQWLMAQKILQEEQMAQEAQNQPPSTSSSSAPVDIPRNDDELFHSYLDTSRLYRPVSIEIPWTETWQLQLAAQSNSTSPVLGGQAGVESVSPAVSSLSLTGRPSVSLSMKAVRSVRSQLEDEVLGGEVSLMTSTIEGVEGVGSAERNQELEERGFDPLSQSTEVPGDSDEAAVAKLAGEIDE